MLSKNQQKFILSLSQKKFREAHNMFIVEGEKVVDELLRSSFEVKEVYATEEWLDPIKTRLCERKGIAVVVLKERELEQISQLKTPNKILALVVIPKQEINDELSGKYLGLSAINDPGNLGTIIRIADWFGFSGIYCSEHTVDCYNPKVVQASMGSLFRVPIFYGSLPDVASRFTQKQLPVLAAMLNGKSVYDVIPSQDMLLLMGSESHGLSKELLAHATEPITIPQIGKAESLNVAVATGIICAQLQRGS